MRYILHPNFVVSRDGDRHFISAPQLVHLFDVPARLCSVRSPIEPQSFQGKGFKKGDVILRPQRDGVYDAKHKGIVVREDDPDPFVYRFWIHQALKPRPTPKSWVERATPEAKAKILDEAEGYRGMDPFTLAHLFLNSKDQLRHISYVLNLAQEIEEFDKSKKTKKLRIHKEATKNEQDEAS